MALPVSVGVVGFLLLGVDMDIGSALSTFAQGGSLLPVAASLLGGSSDGPDHLVKRTRQANEAAIEGKLNAAKKYGISALYALGSPTISPSVSVGGGGGSDLGASLASMGQDISRAVASGQTDAERALQALTLDKAKLENEYLAAQIASIRTRTVKESAPPVPVSGGLSPETAKPPTRTTGINAGIGYQTNPYFSDWENMENRYGESEIGATLGWLVNGIADAVWNAPRRPKSASRQFLQGRTR